MNPRVTDHSTAGGASRGLAARPLLVLPRCQRAGSHHHNKNQNKTPLTQITLQNRLATDVNQQSPLQHLLLAPDQSCESLSHSPRSRPSTTTSSKTLFFLAS